MLTVLVGAVEQLPTPSGIVVSVCMIGIFLAYVTEDLELFTELDPRKYTKDYQAPNLKKSNLSELFALLYYVYQLIQKKVSLICTGYYLKRIAKSKRHFFYLLEKKTLNLPIDANEDEIDSYLDCKRSIGKSWPFMWVVSDVKNSHIKCQDSACIPMSSYCYLDLIRDTRVQEAAVQAAQAWATGNHGPRMLGGNMQILLDLEEAVAKFFGREGALLCAAGYLSTMSAVAAVSTEKTGIFADSRIHASLRAGLQIGEGKYHIFKHNDFVACEALVKKYRRKYTAAWIVIESVYSMDGDICDLPAAYALCQKYDMKIILDEAHGLGVLGKTGRGAEEHFNMPGVATLVVGTFSKSAASVGGYITGPKRYIDYFDFHAPGNVFSAPLPAYCAGAVLKSFEIMTNEQHLITRAQDNSKYLRNLLLTGADQWPENYPESHKYIVQGDPNTAVIPVVFMDDIDRVMRIATRMKENGFMCSAVAYPACPLRAPRFRLTGRTAYTEEIMIKFVTTFVKICIEEKPSITPF